jgi:hypothetical protein
MAGLGHPKAIARQSSARRQAAASQDEKPRILSLFLMRGSTFAAWMAGTSPALTAVRSFGDRYERLVPLGDYGSLLYLCVGPSGTALRPLNAAGVLRACRLAFPSSSSRPDAARGSARRRRSNT